MTGQATRELFARSQAELDFQRKVTDLCDYLHLKWHHEVDSRKSKAGFPDLVIAGNEVIFAELKTETGKISAAQSEWYNRLRNAGATIYLWRPSDWDDIQAVLIRLAGRDRRIV